MKGVIMLRVIAVILAAVLFFSLVAATIEGTDERQPVVNNEQSIPQALDGFYPPQAPAPIYLIEMLKLARYFSGTLTDFIEEDWENSQSNFETFLEQYQKVAKMVPEWEGYYSDDKVHELGKALKARDHQQFMPAFEQVGAQCKNCHLQTIVQVYNQYHWGDYTAITVTDPSNGQDVSFLRLMQLMETDLNSIGIDLEQNQTQEALSHIQSLGIRYRALEETCMSCHDSERRYYVDDDITDMISEMESALTQPSGDPAVVQSLADRVGMESCYKCHLVHIPSAYQD
jgi:hypothetical protein